MANKALFAGVIFDENGRMVVTKFVGSDAQYVVDDQGFLRHIDAEVVDRQVLKIFMENIQQHKGLAVDQALNYLGKDDIFTKAALDSSIDNVNIDEILQAGFPQQAKDMMSMMGFKIVINYRGDVINVEQPGVAYDDE